MSKHNWTKQQLREIAKARIERKRAKAERKARGREKKRLRDNQIEYNTQSGFTFLPPHGWKFFSNFNKV